MNSAASALTRIDQIDVSKIMPLVRSWLERGANLPLAGPFVIHCLESVEQWRQLLNPVSDNATSHETLRSSASSAACVKGLVTNTQKLIFMRQDMRPQEYLGQMLGYNLRGEILGLFFTAAARATYDTAYFSNLYTTHEERCQFMKSLVALGDCCLETCLELDCLNDLQLILQYENFIVHSQVDGDQSKFISSECAAAHVL